MFSNFCYPFQRRFVPRFFLGVLILGCIGSETFSLCPANENELSSIVSEKANSLSELTKLIRTSCQDCHSSDSPEGAFQIDELLEHLENHESHFDPGPWERILRRLRTRQMPPADATRPDDLLLDAAQMELEKWLDDQWERSPNLPWQPGIRRLTRTEYRNAIRDLLGVSIDVEQLLPKDEASHGFDNITVTELSPAFIQRVLAAGQKISQLALGSVPLGPAGLTVRLPADRTQESHVVGLPLGTRGGTVFEYLFPQSGEYEFQIRLMRDRDEMIEGIKNPAPIDVLIDNVPKHRFELSRPSGNQGHTLIDAHLQVRMVVTAGLHQVGVTFPQTGASLIEIKRQPFDAAYNEHRHPRQHPAIYEVSVVGPLQPASNEIPDTQVTRKIFGQAALNPPPELQRQIAQTVLSRLARLAYRRDLTEDDIGGFMAYFESAHSGGFAAGMELGLASILVNPHFFLRIEGSSHNDSEGPPTNTSAEQSAEGSVQHNAESMRKLNDFELASRLSFFLWSSLPDEELLNMASANQLGDPEVLKTQVNRMLADPRSDALVTNFFAQWLYLINLKGLTPDLRLFPDFDENLMQAMRQETEMLIQDIIREDRSILRLIDSDYTFLNERLAVHYDIPGILGSQFRKVILPKNSPRGGLFRHGSILSVTSYATRTSPTIRGSWILENILGTPPPPPPPNVPDLVEKDLNQARTTRERLALHRQNPACASCHNLMDPVGFVLENYDALGRWRDFESDVKIDTKTILPDGTVAKSVSDLEQSLLARPEVFANTLAEKLTIYALGRGLVDSDGPLIRQVVRQASEHEYQFSAIIQGLVASPVFQMRRSE